MRVAEAAVIREIRVYMHKIHLTQQGLCERMQVNYKTLNDSFTGRRAMRLDEYLAICDALDVTPTYFIAKVRTRIIGGKTV